MRQKDCRNSAPKASLIPSLRNWKATCAKPPSASSSSRPRSCATRCASCVARNSCSPETALAWRKKTKAGRDRPIRPGNFVARYWVRIICGCCNGHVLVWGLQVESCCGAGIVMVTLLLSVLIMLIVPPPAFAVYTLVDVGSLATKSGLCPTGTVATTLKLLEFTTLTSFEMEFATYTLSPLGRAVTETGPEPTL